MQLGTREKQVVVDTKENGLHFGQEKNVYNITMERIYNINNHKHGLKQRIQFTEYSAML